MAFSTQPGANGYDNAYFGTDAIDVLVAFNQTGTTYVGGRQEADSITFFQPETGVLSTTTVQSGQGNDTISINEALTSSLLNGNKGDDRINLNFTDAIAESLVYGGSENDILSIDIQTLVNSTINGNTGNDFIGYFGGMASSRIFGGDDNDTIILGIPVPPPGTGGFASDVFTDSRVNGNKGNDVIDGNNINAVVSTTTFNGGQGADTLNFTFGINRQAGDTGFILYGDNGNDQLTGAINQDDELWGGEGNDTVFAGSGKDTVVGGAGADLYAGITSGESTYVIETISDSSAAVSGTARTFDRFESPGSYQFPFDELNIAAVAPGLAGGPVDRNTDILLSNIDNSIGGALNVYTDFGDLQADFNKLGGFTASSTAAIQAYQFTATINGVLGSYLWINDSQALYSSSDLLFQIAAPGQFGPAPAFPLTTNITGAISVV